MDNREPSTQKKEPTQNASTPRSTMRIKLKHCSEHLKEKWLQDAHDLLTSAGVPQWVEVESMPGNSLPHRLQWYLSRRKDVTDNERYGVCNELNDMDRDPRPWLASRPEAAASVQKGNALVAPLLSETPPPPSSTEQKEESGNEALVALSDQVNSPTQNALAPVFVKPEEIEYVWWSWHERYPFWSRSCWKAKTELEARDTINEPLAVGMRNYANTLVREIKRFEVVATSVVADGSSPADGVSSLNPPPPSAELEEIAREVAKAVYNEALTYLRTSDANLRGLYEAGFAKIILTALTKASSLNKSDSLET